MTLDLNDLSLGLYVFLLAYAAISDFRKLRIPNWVSLSLVGVFFLFAMFVRPDIAVLYHVLVGMVVFAAGMVLFSLRWISGGDVKLLSAVALWAGPPHVLVVVYIITVLGALLAVVVLIAKWVQKNGDLFGVPPIVRRAIPSWARLGLCPYGLAISAGALFLLPALFL